MKNSINRDGMQKATQAVEVVVIVPSRFDSTKLRARADKNTTQAIPSGGGYDA